MRDLLIVCCDGLTGLPEAAVAGFPETVVQTCVVVHVTRNAMRFVSYSDRKAVVQAMKEIYTAPTRRRPPRGRPAQPRSTGRAPVHRGGPGRRPQDPTDSAWSATSAATWLRSSFPVGV